MIRSFADKITESIWNREFVKSVAAPVAKTAYRKLFLLHTVTRLQDLNIPPANRLEALKGARRGQHSIRINDQYRICFRWEDGYADDVEVTDYH